MINWNFKRWCMKYQTLFVTAAMAVSSGIFICFLYVNPYEGKITLSEHILQLSGSRGRFALSFSFAELVSFATRMVPEYIFQAYLGMFFYRRFCTASIYIFSRHTKKTKWYLREAGAIGIYSCFFQIIFLCTTVLAASLRFYMRIDKTGLLLAFGHLLLHAIWNYTMAITINLTAIKFGSSTAFTSVIILQAACTALLGAGRYADTSGIAADILWANPISHLVIGWHKNGLKNISRPFDRENFILDWRVSLALYAFLCITAILAGAIIVKRHDILVSNVEKEAV